MAERDKANLSRRSRVRDNARNHRDRTINESTTVERFLEHVGVKPEQVYDLKSGRLNLDHLIALSRSYFEVISTKNIPRDIRGRIIFAAQGVPTLYINTYYTREQQRFMIAHLLGHFAMRTVSKRYQSVDKFTEYGKRLSLFTEAERQADEFAINLLVPAERLAVEVALARSKGRSINDLAKQFAVTRTAMYVRGDRLHHW